MGAATADTNSTRPAGLKIVTVAVASATIAACTTVPSDAPPPPPPPPPPPVEVEATPYRPLPPSGAAYVMNIPRVGADGVRQTVLRDRTDDETVWFFRSGWNVAALNCIAAEYDPILQAYSAYIKDFAAPLKAVNDRIEAEYRREHKTRRATIRAREEDMTAVYNFFALPPARSNFCRSLLDLSNRYLAAAPSDAIVFATANFASIEDPFENFFLAYEQYERDSAAWDAKYGDRFGPSQPGWVAVQQARAEGRIPTAGVSDPTSTLASPTSRGRTVADSETGAPIPVVPVTEGVVSQPVVEPIATDNSGSEDGDPIGPVAGPG